MNFMTYEFVRKYLTPEGDKNPNNVAGGLKATINNPNNTEEAKQAAKERLEGM